MSAQAAWYLLVESATEGFAAYQRLRVAGFAVRIAPVPHGMQACCGMSIMTGDGQIDAVRTFAEQERLPIVDAVRVESALNPGRDAFC